MNEYGLQTTKTIVALENLAGTTQVITFELQRLRQAVVNMGLWTRLKLLFFSIKG